MLKPWLCSILLIQIILTGLRLVAVHHLLSLTGKPTVLNKTLSLYLSVFLKCIGFTVLYLFPTDGHTQYGKEPEPELSMGINVVTGSIQYGSNDYYITDRGSAALGPMFRYDHP